MVVNNRTKDGENRTGPELNAGEYVHYRRKVLGFDEDGNPIFGERERMEPGEGDA